MSDPTTTSIVRALRESEDNEPRAIVPRNFAEAREMSEYISKAALIPAAMRSSPHNVFAIVAAGAELGMAPMAALRAFHVIEGVPRLSADALVAICLSRGDLCEFFYPIEQTDTRSTWATKRRGSPAEVRRSWDVDRATKAGLIGRGTWKLHQPRMLSARAKAELARDVFPDLCAGLFTPDEDDLAPIATGGGVEVFARPADPAPAKIAPLKAVKPPAPAKEPAPTNGTTPPSTEPAPVSVPASFPPKAPIVPLRSEAPAPAPAARSDYEASQARIEAAAAALAHEDDAIGAEIVEPPAPEDFGAPAPAVPAEMAAFRVALAAAQGAEDLKLVRAKFVPWSNTSVGRPFATAMKDEWLSRDAAIRASSGA